MGTCIKPHEFEKLLAKSIPARDCSQSEQDYKKAKGAATFRGHLGAVLAAAEVLTQQLAKVIQTQLQLSDSDLELLVKITQLGAYLHDWGKANQHFQEMVYIKSSLLDPQTKKKIVQQWQQHGSRQLIRHEFLSGILSLEVDGIREWLEKKFSQKELILAVWAAIGHHLKAGVEPGESESTKITHLPDGTGSGLWIYTNHPDFRAILTLGSQKLNLDSEIPIVESQYWEKIALEGKLESLQKHFYTIEKELTSKQQLIVAIAKAMVISADLAGSILPAQGEALRDWIPQVLTLGLTQEDLTRLVTEKLERHSLRCFQTQMANSPHRVTLVKAGCGTGKTLGAYVWGQKWAVGKRLFFGYPTTGTATQGYLDYAQGSPLEAMLMHSRADLDRELLCSGEGEEEEGISSRLAALQTWRKKLVVCTVDAILGLVQNNRRSLFAWPMLVQSAFVFDEVHAYDSQLFGSLLRFLKIFRGAPILLMSASFTPGQLDAIRQAMAEIGEEIGDPIEGPKELEDLKRYQLQKIDTINGDPIQAEILWERAREAVQLKQKVLWVTNSVSSCIDIYQLAKKKLSELKQSILIYHSRFRYRDRVEKHRQIIEAFKSSEGVFAVTTQVCEMSLDLSADLLISAIAPAAALIQRLGRLNRRMTNESQGSRLALFYEWQQPQPYTEAELASGRQLLEQLSHLETVSQSDLAEVAAQLDLRTLTPVTSAWLDQNWRTYPDSVREQGYTITALLAEDQANIWKAAEQRQQKALAKGQKLSRMQAFLQEAQAWSIPIRIPKAEWWTWQRRGFYLITSPGYITYSEEVGTP